MTRIILILCLSNLVGCLASNPASQTTTFILDELDFFTKDEICSKATWVDNRGIISWRSNLDPFVKAAKKTAHRCSVGSHVSDANQHVGKDDQITNTGNQIGKIARVQPSTYKGYNLNNSNKTKPTSKSLKKEETTNYDSAFAYATYDPSSITPIRCAKTGGLFGINDKKCIDKISTTCKRLYPKNESPKQAANEKTCGIKSLKQNYPKNADVNFLVPFLIKERAYYLLAHQGNISWAEAIALNTQSVIERDRYFAEITQQRRIRGLTLANLGFCIASSGIEDCLGGGTSSNNPIRNQNGFLTQNYSVGANRVCVYNQGGSNHAITLSGNSLCPLSLNKAKAVDGLPKPKVEISAGKSFQVSTKSASITAVHLHGMTLLI